MHGFCDLAGLGSNDLAPMTSSQETEVVSAVKMGIITVFPL